ncbi:hypothetical protein [Chryseobacterium sp. JK1]|uniref:hypothetical protein n=1 Tax=Chryseobacterium sp. JK1 TaxID=874294 RepID=UPI003D697006
MFKSVFEEEFYQNLQVFAAPPILREMLLYALKWNQSFVEMMNRVFSLKRF